MSSLTKPRRPQGANNCGTHTNHHRMRLLCIALGMIAMAGCATNKKTAAPVYPLKYETPYKMAPLDEARVHRADSSDTVVQVTLDGMADLESGPKYVKGMPVDKFRALMQKAYPKAKIEIVEFRPNRVTVLGEVFHQIHTDLGDGPMRVMDAIAAANGFTPLANKRRVKLVRQNAGAVEAWELDLRQMLLGDDLEQNMLLKPGDVITVPRNFL